MEMDLVLCLGSLYGFHWSILTQIYRHSLDIGAVPQDWSDAWVVPIFKKGERHIPANYRPVSLTSIAIVV
jgi:nitrate reductase gamma subunit